MFARSYFPGGYFPPVEAAPAVPTGGRRRPVAGRVPDDQWMADDEWFMMLT
jgi:hypothetical protein